MFTKPNQVIIGKTIKLSGELSDLAVGDIFVADETMTESAGQSSKSIHIGVCTAIEDGTPIMRWADRIQKESKPTFFGTKAEPATAAKIEISLSAAEIVVGHRYVLRVLYKDMNVANFQFTHTYEHIATSEAADDLGKALAAKIQKHANRRVNAAYSGGTLTLTAMEKNYDNSVTALDEYSIVSMDASLYVTIPGALLSNQPEKVTGVSFNKVEGNPGRGHWKQVRDIELRAMGYRGKVYTGAYPSIEQERMVTKGASYNTLTIENDNLYLSPDNQYVKTTPVMTTIFCEDENSFLNLKTFLRNFGAHQLDDDTSLGA